MRILKDLSAVRNLPPVFLTFGFFDGFHAGHRHILSRLVSHCRRISACSLVVTFEDLPGEEGVRKHIYPLKTKLRILKKIGIDYCLFLNFSQVREMDYLSFLDVFFIGGEVRGLIASDKLRLGYQRGGRPEQVRKYFFEKGSRAYFLPSLKSSGGKEISSTEIRKLLIDGQIYRANQKLKLPFHLTAIVRKGKSWGREIGFPTMNFLYPEDSVGIPSGSYITVTEVGGKIHPSMTYVGFPLENPGEKSDERGKKLKKPPLVETYLLNFSKSVYNRWVTVYFIKNLAENKQIEDLSELQFFLNRLKIRLQNYLGRNTVFFQEKLKWIEQNIIDQQ